MTATYGIAKGKEISQIFKLQTRGTKIPRPACMAIDNHRGILLPSEHGGERETFALSYITIDSVGMRGSGSVRNRRERARLQTCRKGPKMGMGLQPLRNGLFKLPHYRIKT